MYDLETLEFFVSRDVKFVEDRFPFLDTSITSSESVPGHLVSSSEVVDVDFDDYVVGGVDQQQPLVSPLGSLSSSAVPSSATPSAEVSLTPRRRSIILA